MRICRKAASSIYLPLFAFFATCASQHAAAQQVSSASIELTANLSHKRSGIQSQPAVAALKRDGFVIVWKDDVEADGSTGGGDIKAATFDDQGNRISSGRPISAFGDYQINTLITSGRQEHPAVVDISQTIQTPLCIPTPRGSVCLDSWRDRIVFAWTDNSQISTNQSEDVRGAIWNPMPSPLRSLQQPVPIQTVQQVVADFPISTEPGKQNRPAVADIGNGNFICAFADEGEIDTQTGKDEHDSGVIVTIGSSIGNLQAPILINTDKTLDSQSEVSLASGGGGLLISWTDANQNGAGKGINGSNYSLGPTNPLMMCMMGGPCTSQETPINQAIQGNQQTSDSAATAARFVTVWQDDRNGTQDIFGNFVPASGTDFLINDVSSGAETTPAVAELHVGTTSVGFVVVWNTYLAESSGGTGTSEVMARVFNSSGAPTGPSFRVNAFGVTGPNEAIEIRHSQDEADVAGLEDGRFVVVWSDGCCNSGDVKYRVFRSPFSP